MCAEDHPHDIFTIDKIDTTPPVITNRSFTIADNIPIGTVIGTITKTNNIDIAYYSIIAGNTGSAFTINTNGQISTITTLDYNVISNYNILVLVADVVGNNATAIITVSITNVPIPNITATPTVTTIRASGIQNNSAILNGNLNELGTNSNGNNQVNEYGFVYSLTASHTDDLQLGKIGVSRVGRTKITNTGHYSFAIAGLHPCAIYYFRAFAVNDGGIAYGETSNFSTSSTYHRSFILSGEENGLQSSMLCAYSIHTYNVPLSYQKAYSLSLEADSNISANVNIYEGTNTNTLYIKASPFSESSEGMTITFSEISNGTRYMVLPLVSNTHRIVFSNNSDQNQNYNLNIEEYFGTIPATGRLLTTPDKMGYYDSTNDTRFFWAHIPPNKNVWVVLDELRTRVDVTTAVVLMADSSATYGSSSMLSRSLIVNNSGSQYRLLTMRNTLGVTGTGQQTIARFVFSFIDP